jgi:dTDP-4-dehydrorhamnose reductase
MIKYAVFLPNNGNDDGQPTYIYGNSIVEGDQAIKILNNKSEIVFIAPYSSIFGIFRTNE